MKQENMQFLTFMARLLVGQCHSDDMMECYVHPKQKTIYLARQENQIDIYTEHFTIGIGGIDHIYVM